MPLPHTTAHAHLTHHRDASVRLAQHWPVTQAMSRSLLPQEAAQQVEKILGGKGLDVLINNAGTSEDLVPPVET